MKKVMVVSGISLLLLGCSQFASNGDKLYLRSKNAPGLVVTPPLTDTNISHFYDLPTPKTKTSEVSVVPPYVAPQKAQHSL